MDREACERGLEIRREVLGDDYVAQAQSRVDEFTRPFQDFLNGYCWGEIRAGRGCRGRSAACSTSPC